jgi:hypothetical protein
MWTLAFVQLLALWYGTGAVTEDAEGSAGVPNGGRSKSQALHGPATIGIDVISPVGKNSQPNRRESLNPVISPARRLISKLPD